MSLIRYGGLSRLPALCLIPARVVLQARCPLPRVVPLACGFHLVPRKSQDYHAVCISTRFIVLFSRSYSNSTSYGWYLRSEGFHTTPELTYSTCYVSYRANIASSNPASNGKTSLDTSFSKNLFCVRLYNTNRKKPFASIFVITTNHTHNTTSKSICPDLGR